MIQKQMLSVVLYCLLSIELFFHMLIFRWRFPNGMSLRIIQTFRMKRMNKLCRREWTNLWFSYSSNNKQTCERHQKHSANEKVHTAVTFIHYHFYLVAAAEVNLDFTTAAFSSFIIISISLKLFLLLPLYSYAERINIVRLQIINSLELNTVL